MFRAERASAINEEYLVIRRWTPQALYKAGFLLWPQDQMGAVAHVVVVDIEEAVGGV